MNKPTQPNQAPDELTQHFWQAWREQLAKTPRLARLFLQRGRELLERFQRIYAQLCKAPRPLRRRWQRKLGTSLAGVALLLALNGAPAARAADFTANDAATLVAAINAANDEGANPGPDTITLLSDVTLYAVDNNTVGNNGLPAITSAITISSNGHTIARDAGAPDFRIFQVSVSGNLTLNDTTITGGNLYGPNIDYSGGGILNQGTLTLGNSIVSGNSSVRGGGIYNRSSSTTLINSTVSDNSAFFDGGGIFARFSTMTLNNSTVSNNNATYSSGGGISSLYGTTTLNNSTVSGNSALDGRGGGIANNGALTLNNSTVSNNRTLRGGGGINHTTGALTLNNSTVSNNRSYSTSYGGGGINNNAMLTLSNSTVSNNEAYKGGGIINGTEGDATLERSLISGNTATDAGYEINNEIVTLPSYLTPYCTLFGGTIIDDECVLAGTVTADNYNLFGHSGGSNAQAFANFTPGGSDITATSDGTTPTALTAVLDTTLADNGGPTLTHALVTGSPAVDAAPGGPATDQRGVSRPQGPAFDIGAFELEQVVNMAPVAVDDSYSTNEDTVLTVPAPGVLGNDTDADSDPLTAVVVSGPSHGTLTLNADGSFTYTPAANYNGTDSFTYKANDGSEDSNVATVNLTVLSAADQITQLTADVQALVDSNTLSPADADKFFKDLDQAQKHLDKGQTQPTINMLQNFIKDVNKVVNNGGLPAAEGQALIDAANAAINSLNSGASAASIDAQSTQVFLPLVAQ